VALHWLQGLIHFTRGDNERALRAFERELTFEESGHLYGRECCANTWYAIGAVRFHQRDRDTAALAFREALARVARHPLARLGLAALGSPVDVSALQSLDSVSVDASIGKAVGLALAGRHGEAAALVAERLASAPPGNAGWLLPVEPLLHVSTHSDLWSPALARLRARAA
jgi:hypothetical protein